MAISSRSYGSVPEVAALTKKYTDTTTSPRTFSTTTTPTLSQVEQYIDRVSGILNVMLAEQGFAIPVSQADAKLALDQFVVAQVADLVNFSNSAGRFFQNQDLRNGPFYAIMKEAELFISKHALGFVNLGAVRTGITEDEATTFLSAGVLQLDFQEPALTGEA